MSSGSYLIILCALTVFSLTAVSIVNNRDERRRSQQQRQRQLRFKLQDLEELVLHINQLVENRQITMRLNEELLETIVSIRETEPDNSHLNALYHAALARHESLTAEDGSSNYDDLDLPALDRLQHSDAGIARAKRILSESLIILRRQQRSGKIPLEELRLVQLDLSWANLMVEVISLIGQGHKSVRRREIFTGHAYYKKAQQLLIQSSHPDKRRRQFIQEINEMMFGKRRSISPELMPERALNPDASETQLLDLPEEEDILPDASVTDAEEEDVPIIGLEAWQT